MQKESGYGHLLAHALLAGGAAYGVGKYLKNRRREKDLKVPLHKVDSSMIRELGYVPENKTMHARFNTGKRYKFKDMPYSEYRKLKKAESIGTHFNKHVKDKYKFEKLSAISTGMKWLAGTTAAGGAAIGGLQKDDQGNKGGVGGMISGAMMGAAMPFAAKSIGKGIGSGISKGYDKFFKVPGAKPKPLKTGSSPVATSTPPTAQNTGSTVQTQGTLPPPAEKLASYNGICMIDDELFEKSASATFLTHTAIGAGVGALSAGEGNRLQGALLGAGAGAAGSMAGRMVGKHMATKGMTPAQATKMKSSQQALEMQLRNTKGLTARHDAIEAFLKQPAHAEFAQAYRSSMQGAAGLAALSGAGAGLMANKTAAYRAVERLNNV